MRILAFLATFILSGQANAAIISFDYLGPHMDCYSPLYCSSYQDSDGNNIAGERKSGGFSIDLNELPTGTLLGYTINFRAADSLIDRDLLEGLSRFSYSITKEGKVLHADSWIAGSAELGWVQAPVLLLNQTRGGFWDVFAPVAYQSSISLTLGKRGQVRAWRMDVTTGGSGDWVSTPYADGDGDHFGYGPGKWSVDGGPYLAPVPLPASGAMLFSSIFVIAALRRRNRKVVNAQVVQG